MKFGSLIDVLMILSYLQNKTFPNIETYLHCEIDPWVEKDKTNHWNEAWICNSCWEVAHLISNVIPRVYTYKCASIYDTRWSSATLYYDISLRVRYRNSCKGTSASLMFSAHSAMTILVFPPKNLWDHNNYNHNHNHYDW